jgi:hypothetical protein
VFAVLPPNRLMVADREVPGVYTFWLLGLVRGHWEQEDVSTTSRLIPPSGRV